MDSKNKEIGISAIKTLFGAIPFGIGTALDEAIFEGRSRIKQDRLNKFNNLLIEYFENMEPNFDLNNLKTEEFSDVLESVLKKVMETNNLNKLERFKNILVGQMSSSNIDMDFIETYLDITSKLGEIQIRILNQFYEKDSIKKQLKKNIDEATEKIEKAKYLFQELKTKAQTGSILISESLARTQKQIATFEGEKVRIENELDKHISYTKPEYYNLSKDDYDFFTQDLVSKSLLNETFYTTLGATIPIKGISEFGIRYIKFIKQE